MTRKKNLRWEEMDKSNTDLSVLMQHFEVNNRTEGKSPKTVGWYNEVLGLFLSFVRGIGLAALIATHNLDLAARLDRTVRIEDGILVAGHQRV
ncbi:MAG: hypothetical protein CFH40_01719 [Alphaproteobacteria bacterium MarineAlpha10_Bin3]|nr:MAG: hypothetical protein CFH40_01719 [Alphaproteobacteria bacterium MarineAlpha10_Bin3]PPR69637.1 MAG: hypothetical protein CFH09_01719 [Alphaproteobacteria bacterium MarineAlpha4_Bin1]